MQKIIGIFISVLLIGTLFPFVFSVIGSEKINVCYPIPSFMYGLQNAYASPTWSYYFNTTNNRWYNHTQVTELVNDYNSTIYTKYTNTPTGEYVGNIADGADEHIAGQYVTLTDAINLLNKPINIIKVNLWKRLNNPTGNATIGVFSSSTGALKAEFGQVDTSTLVAFTPQNYTFVRSSNYTLVAGDIVGVYFNPPSTGENYIQVSYEVLGFDYDSGHNGKLAVYTNSNFLYGDRALIADFGVQHFKEVTVDGYILLPLTWHGQSGGIPVMTQTGRQQCSDTWSLISTIEVVAMVSIIVGLLVVIKKVRTNR